MAKNVYETVIVTSAKLGEEGNAELVERFKTLIEQHGTIQDVDDWGKRRFAYPIQKQTEGFYTLITFESEPDFTAELDRRYQITDGILRTLIVKRDPRHLAPKKVKAHAVPSEEEAPAEAKEAPAEETAPVEAPAVETAPAEEAE